MSRCPDLAAAKEVAVHGYVGPPPGSY